MQWLVVMLCATLAAAAARADDWLASLPETAAQLHGLPALTLMYPEPSLPAVVSAGDVLAARVQLPAALTPPPGVQQARALVGFAAELIGEAIAITGEGGEHRYTLPVIALRPDAGSSLVYRVRLAIPAYAAPGTYSLLLRTPFGERTAARSVRVIAAGAAVKVAGCPPLTAADEDLAGMPVDVWICAREPSAGAPRLVVADRALALRVGSELWVHAGQAAAPGDFERELRSVAEAESLTRVAFPASHALTPPPSAAGPRTQRTSTGFLLDNRGGLHDRVVSLLLPARRQLRVLSGQLTLYPATSLARSDVHTIVGLLHADRDATAEIALGAELPREPRFSLPQIQARSGVPTRVRVRGVPTGANVAFEYGLASSAWPAPELQLRFAGPVEQPLRALVLPATGGAELLRARPGIEPQRPPGCSATPEQGAPSTSICASLLFALSILVKRRSRRGFGNRLRAHFRFEQLMVFRIATFIARIAGLGVLLALAACEPTLIPNTHVEDTSDNREVIDFVEKYRQAVETRNTHALLALASNNYFDDMGTPSGTDDIDYDGLKAALARMREEVLGARYQISYRAVTFDTESRVLVDVLYTGWFRINGNEGPEWKRRLEPHRMVLAREDGNYRITSGM